MVVKQIKCTLSLSLMMVNYILNHHWYETSLLPQAALSLNYICDVQRFHCQKSVQLRDHSVSLQKWRNLYGIVSYQILLCLHHNLHYFTLLQHVTHIAKCVGHMYATMTSGLLSGSSRSTVWHSFWHENL